MRTDYRGILAAVPPYTVSGPPAGAAYLLGMLSAHGVHDVSFVDLRLREPAWDVLTYSAIGASNESFVLDTPDLPLVLHLLHHLPETDVWRDLERAPWLLRYCRARKLSAPRLAASAPGLLLLLPRLPFFLVQLACCGRIRCHANSLWSPVKATCA